MKQLKRLKCYRWYTEKRHWNPSSLGRVLRSPELLDLYCYSSRRFEQRKRFFSLLPFAERVGRVSVSLISPNSLLSFLPPFFTMAHRAGVHRQPKNSLVKITPRRGAKILGDEFWHTRARTCTPDTRYRRAILTSRNRFYKDFDACKNITLEF